MKRSICVVADTRRGKSAFRIPAAFLLACCALVLFCGSVAAAQDQQPAAPAGQNQQQTASPAKEMPPMPTAPSGARRSSTSIGRGKRLPAPPPMTIFMSMAFIWPTLQNGEYAGMEVGPGKVVVTGLPEMYTVDIFTAAGAAVNEPQGRRTRGFGSRRSRVRPTI